MLWYRAESISVATLDAHAEWRVLTGTQVQGTGVSADPQSAENRISLMRAEKNVSVEADAPRGRGVLQIVSSFLEGVTSYFRKSETLIREIPLLDKKVNFVTIFSAACSMYHDWQSVVLHHTWRRAKFPGKLVRLLACAPEERHKYNRFHELGDGLETHMHDDRTFEAGKSYSLLNKPWGILSWLTEGSGRSLQNDTVVLIVDPDMAFKADDAMLGFMPLIQRVQSSGHALGLDYSYVRSGMRYNNWSLPLQFLPKHRLGFLQSIGPPMLIRKDHLAHLAQAWHNITLSIVKDPVMETLVHDGSQQAPWIAEMYGYSLAAAMQFPRTHETQRQWPALQAPQPPWAATGSSQGLEKPLILHYSHPFNLCRKPFGKNRYVKTDLLDCSLTTAEFDEMLQPPAKEQVNSEECGLCLGKGDVIGFRSTCLNPIGKPVSFEAWRQVYTALKFWRSEHCFETS